ncbi:MAG TPA: outer membrane lipoprotein carrier protein LolA [Pirellulaceae bacterium]|nr:outer membrane lipoprotein carrier protein LolA [Pirellulaceae bacterium]
MWIAVLAGGLASAGGETPPADGGGLIALKALLDEMRSVQTLSTSFRCEKRMESLDVPLLSQGRLLVARREERVSMRLTTESPYFSELILADGKSRARSQHEASWSSSDQSSRPGLTAVMVLVAGCSVGELGNLADYFSVRPAETAAAPPSPPDPVPKTWFVLEPTNKDMAIAVREVRLGFAGPGVKSAPGIRSLTDAVIVTAQGDVTHYEFFSPAFNAALPADAFRPVTLRPEGVFGAEVSP